MLNPEIDYPYMPEDRELKYVSAEHPFMKEAEKAREECAGDSIFPVGIVLVKDGLVVARAGNGFNRDPGEAHICPRIVEECPSGVGYDLCDLHDPPGHAEPMLVRVCEEKGIDMTGADAYLYGHWWACEPCWKALIDAGIRDLYVTEDAHERFSRDRVYGKTLVPSVKSSYIAGALTCVTGEEGQALRRFFEDLGKACDEIGIKGFVPHLHSDPEVHLDMTPREVYDADTNHILESDVLIADATNPSTGTGGELVFAHERGKPIILLSKKGVPVSRFALGNPAVVYHLEYESYEEACRKVQHILKCL